LRYSFRHSAGVLLHGEEYRIFLSFSTLTHLKLDICSVSPSKLKGKIKSRMRPRVAVGRRIVDAPSSASPPHAEVRDLQKIAAGAGTALPPTSKTTSMKLGTVLLNLRGRQNWGLCPGAGLAEALRAECPGFRRSRGNLMNSKTAFQCSARNLATVTLVCVVFGACGCKTEAPVPAPTPTGAVEAVAASAPAPTDELSRDEKEAFLSEELKELSGLSWTELRKMADDDPQAARALMRAHARKFALTDEELRQLLLPMTLKKAGLDEATARSLADKSPKAARAILKMHASPTEKIQGAWAVDLDALSEMDELRSMPAEERRAALEMAKGMMATATITFTDDAVHMEMMGKKESAPYRVVESDGRRLVLATEKDGRTENVTVEVAGDKMIMHMGDKEKMPLIRRR
jgi:hypothetical protein